MHAGVDGPLEQHGVEGCPVCLEAKPRSLAVRAEGQEPGRRTPAHPVPVVAGETGDGHPCGDTKCFQERLDAGVEGLARSVDRAGVALDQCDVQPPEGTPRGRRGAARPATHHNDIEVLSRRLGGRRD